jgi:hypothetical protein
MGINKKRFLTAALSTMLVAACIQPGQASAAQPFPDVPAGHWAATAIEDLASSGLISGYEDGSFQPDRYVTQEEFVALAVNLLFGKPADTTPEDPYEQISWSDWAYDRLEQEGINSLEEYWARGGTKRKIEISRGEAARIVYKLLNGNVEMLPTKIAVQDLYEKNLTTGTYTDRADYFENYGPADRVTRAQAAVFLTKVRDYKAGKLEESGNIPSFKDSLIQRTTAVGKTYGMSINATYNDERYQTEVTGNGMRLDYQYNEYAYGDLGEHWHMTIAEMDNNQIPFMASLLVELGLPMGETEAKDMLRGLLSLEYGQTGETYTIGKMAIYTSYYYGYHVQWGEKTEERPVEAPSESYAVFVNGKEMRGPGFNTFLDPVFSRAGEIYLPVDTLYDVLDYDQTDDWQLGMISLGNGDYWEFEWDGVPKRNGSTYIGKRIIGEDDIASMNAIMKEGQLYLPMSFVSAYFPVQVRQEEGTTVIFVGAVPEPYSLHYFGTEGKYPSTFEFDPLDPAIAYPGGWKAPQLESVWSADQAQNYEAFKNELGFGDGGRAFGITGAHKAITIFNASDNDDTEVTIRYTMWGTPPGQPEATVSESFKIPVISAQLFKFYFENDWRTVWEYCNRNDIPEQFTLNGRTVHVAYYPIDGTLHFDIGFKSN